MPGSRAGNASAGMLLVAIAALLGALTLYQVAQFVVTTAEAQHAATVAMTTHPGDPNDKAGQADPAKSLAAKLKEKNLFIPPQPKTNPVQGVEGILGSEALINGQWYKAGQKVGDAEVLVVEATRVKVSWNGQEMEFTADGPGGGGPGGPPDGPPSSSGAGRRSSRPDRAERGMSGPRPDGPSMGRPEMPMPTELPQNMSPEDMQRFREQMRERAATRSR